MTEAEVQAFCANNGISVSPIGAPLHVVDPENLPPSVRKFVNDDGSYAGDNTPEAEDPRHEESKGETPGESENTASGLSGEDTEGVEMKGRLPRDFPHYKELSEAGITSYGKLRALNGDYSEVAGIGPAKGAEIDEALGLSTEE